MIHVNLMANKTEFCVVYSADEFDFLGCMHEQLQAELLGYLK